MTTRHLPLLAAAAGLTAFAGLPVAVDAQVITQFNFNSPTPDANVATGTTTPSTGTGSVALIGGTTAIFASGDANGGSTDPVTGDDSGYGVTTFPAQGSNNETAGLQVSVSTLGFQNIQLTYDLRHSNTASRFESVSYTTDGTNYIRLSLSPTNASAGTGAGATFGAAGTFSGPAGDTWFNNRTVNFTGIAGVDNNPLFAVRIVSSFDGTTGYVASSGTGTYATTGTWRFDQVTVSAIPEPSTYALLALGGGLALCGYVRHRRPRTA